MSANTFVLLYLMQPGLAPDGSLTEEYKDKQHKRTNKSDGDGIPMQSIPNKSQNHAHRCYIWQEPLAQPFSHRRSLLHRFRPHRSRTSQPRLTSWAHRRVHRHVSLAPLRSAPHSCPPPPHSPCPIRTRSRPRRALQPAQQVASRRRS